MPGAFSPIPRYRSPIMPRKQDPTPNPDHPPDPTSLSYEQAIELVESIADQIESGEIGLEQSIAAYEQGISLIRRCRAILDQAEQRITELTDAAARDNTNTNPTPTNPGESRKPA